MCAGLSLFPFCCLPLPASLFQVVCPLNNGHIGPVLEVRVEAAKEVTRDNFLVRLHCPAGSWDTAGQGRYSFFIFCRGGPCPPGAYNLAGETQLMHTYTISTISDYHNIDHNCVRPGKARSVRGWGLGEGVLVKMGFI